MTHIFNMRIKYGAVFFTAVLYSYTFASPAEKWSGKWFPAAPGAEDLNPSVDDQEVPHALHDAKHGIKMGIPSNKCDDGKTNLTVDWNESPEAYLCFDLKSTYRPNIDTRPVFSSDHIPSHYWAVHACMNTTIEYNDQIPTFGTHRPLWARFGEYKYLPPQRWLHNLEHGSIAMLYHPCADKHQVQKLKKIVKKCLYRHVITPYNQLDAERPLALVAWGHRLTMSVVDVDVATSFIKNHALKGPEKVSRDGQFDKELVEAAEFVTNQQDTKLCPNL